MHDSNEKDEKKQDMNEEKGTVDNAGLNMNGHIIILIRKLAKKLPIKEMLYITVTWQELLLQH